MWCPSIILISFWCPFVHPSSSLMYFTIFKSCFILELVFANLKICLPPRWYQASGKSTHSHHFLPLLSLSLPSTFLLCSSLSCVSYPPLLCNHKVFKSLAFSFIFFCTSSFHHHDSVYTFDLLDETSKVFFAIYQMVSVIATHILFESSDWLG